MDHMDERGTDNLRSSASAAAKAPKPKLLSMRGVTALKVNGGAALVEYVETGQVVRVTIPAEALNDNEQVPADVLAEGVPYGLPWDKAPVANVTPEKIAQALHNAGIWTAEDLRKEPNAARGALQAAYGLDLGALNAFARDFGKETSDG